MREEACQGQQGQMEPAQLASLILHQEGHLALIVRGRERWQATAGYTLLPLEFPGAAPQPGEAPAEAAAALGPHMLGCPVRVYSSRTVYGPSAAHRVDRIGILPQEGPVPLLRVERMAPEEREGGIALRPVVLRGYLAVATGQAASGADLAGLLWLTPSALRLAVRGLFFTELLAQEDVHWQPAERCAVPEDAFAYVPSEYGERFLLRALAKYGPHAVLQGANDGAGI
jgi:hypothetical protein